MHTNYGLSIELYDQVINFYKSIHILTDSTIITLFQVGNDGSTSWARRLPDLSA
jgi:hypothetical protein